MAKQLKYGILTVEVLKNKKWEFYKDYRAYVVVLENGEWDDMTFKLKFLIKTKDVSKFRAAKFQELDDLGKVNYN